MATAIPISKRGTVKIRKEMRKHLLINQLQNLILLFEERGRKLYLEPTAAIPVRDIPKSTLRTWIKEDEKEMATFPSTK